MAEIGAHLRAAQEQIAAGQCKEALQHCKAALKADRSNYEALILVGRAAQGLGEVQQSELAYRRAAAGDTRRPDAWHGLAELFASTGNNTAGMIDAIEHLLPLLPEEDASRRQYGLWLADAYNKAGEFGKGATQLRQLLAHSTAGEGLAAERMEVLCRLADIQLRLDEAKAVEELEARMQRSPSAAGGSGEGAATTGPPHRTVSVLQLDVLSQQAVQDEQQEEHSTSETLLQICSGAPLSLRHTIYFDEYLKRCLLKVFSAPPRSVERQQYRLAALRECHTCIFRACCSALPYEAGIWLLEEEEEIKGGHVPVGGQVVGSSCGLAAGVQPGGEGHIGSGQQSVVYAFENFARRMAHQFPTANTAQVVMALMLRRRACHDGTRPVPQKLRRQLEQVLARAMADETQNDCATGWKALAELQYENRHYTTAYETAVRGLRWLHRRRERGHEALTQIALTLRLVLAKSLRRLSRLDEAETHFRVLAGWVTEGEAAFGDMSGGSPMSIHQQALRGIALVALERGDKAAAKAQYERILGKAALGRGPAEHWAHADYGWLLFLEGDLQSARQHLEQALQVSLSAGCTLTDSQLAEHHYRLGEVYYKLRGRYRSDKQFAYTQFYEAARVEGHGQAAALAALGRFFQEVDHRPEQAMRCYKRALALDPTVAIAGSPRSGKQPQLGEVVPDWVNDVLDEAAAEGPQSPGQVAAAAAAELAPGSPHGSVAASKARITTE